MQADAEFGVLLCERNRFLKPGSFTIKLAVVKMPSRCARMTASLMECERPKSSALTMRRQPDFRFEGTEFIVSAAAKDRVQGRP